MSDWQRARSMPAGRWPNINRTDGRAPIPPHIRRGVFIRDDYRCKLCGWQGASFTLHLDHIVPWSAGGPDESGNLRTLCARCNVERSNHRIVEDGRNVPPIAAGCLDCQPGELHQGGTLALCMGCRSYSYSNAVDRCWQSTYCDCGDLPEFELGPFGGRW